MIGRAGVFAICFAAVSAARGENWPSWRGPRADGTSIETNLPTTWSRSENVAWRTPLPGPAGATPIVWKDRIFLTSTDADALVLLCLDTDGEILWRQTLGGGNQNVRVDEGNSASPSPSTDGEHVWSMIGTGMLACHDFEGNRVWNVDLQERYGRFQIQFGMTSTPVLDGAVLYLQLIHSGGARVLALDKNTGAEIWNRERPSDAKAECEHSYASPILYRDDTRAFLVSHGADYVIGHRLDDGSEIFRCGGLNPKTRYNPTLRFVASPVAVAGLIVVPSAKKGPVLGLRPDAKGDVTGSNAGLAWTMERNTPDVPSPLVAGGLVYLCGESGVLTCLDAKTGAELYRESAHRERHRASPLYADGKVYLTGRDGVVTVVKAGRSFEVLASNELGDETAASPIVSGGTIYCRTFDALYAIRASKSVTERSR